MRKKSFFKFELKSKSSVIKNKLRMVNLHKINQKNNHNFFDKSYLSEDEFESLCKLKKENNLFI